MKDDLNDELKANQLRYWQSRPAIERLNAVSELSILMYRLEHGGADPPPFDFTKAAVCFLPFPEGEDDDTL